MKRFIGYVGGYGAEIAYQDLAGYLKEILVDVNTRVYVNAVCTDDNMQGVVFSTEEVSQEEALLYFKDCIEDDDGDYGVVTCGKCNKKLYRCEAFLSDKYLYLCNDCEED